MAKGIVAAGHKLTMQAAEEVLNEGGNAFDAAIAAFYAACVAEPVLASPGGGGFLIAHAKNQQPIIYDFFVQTPKNNKVDEIDFLPIVADFGEAQQEFHIGYGSIATPGAIRGVFDIHRDLSSMPMQELVKPAIEFSKQGILTNDFQAYILDIVSPIFLHSSKAQKIFSSPKNTGDLLSAGDVYYPGDLINALDAIAIEGDRLFYEGEIASEIVKACQTSGGLLTRQDLSEYQCIKRTPLSLDYKGCRILTNPPPSSGGVLIAFALEMLQNTSTDNYSFGSYESLMSLISAMEVTQAARLNKKLELDELYKLLDKNLITEYVDKVQRAAKSYRGTTHISIIDDKGNMAGLTLSNGEGCGHVLNDTGIMLNNMLGEQDLNPHGFFQWIPDRRMTSMMSPGILHFKDGRHVVTGSGGSNRIRTALMQVIVNLIDHQFSIEKAVQSPRLHFEDGVLNIEGQFAPEVIEKIIMRYPKHQIWPEPNLFFGGAHSVMQAGANFSGVGDCRRGGVSNSLS